MKSKKINIYLYIYHVKNAPLTTKIHSFAQIITAFPNLIYMNRGTLVSSPSFLYKYDPLELVNTHKS